MTAAEICQMDAVSLSKTITAKQLSPVEVVDAVLERLDRLDPAGGRHRHRAVLAGQRRRRLDPHPGQRLPIGMQIIGPYLEDRTTIAFAEYIEREIGGFVPPPG